MQAARAAISAGDPDRARAEAERIRRRMLTPVINATGVLLHTNMGRAPVGLHQPAGYTNLEIDLETGQRGSRHDRTASLLATACGAEAAIIVNNCASAMLLILAALADGNSVAVSRGELVEIGGGFRVPDVMEQSGAQLVEVGTTNRTRRSDFVTAAEQHDLALLLAVHQSNYRITGFTEAVTIDELASIGPPVVADIGSGLLDASCPWLDGPPPAWLDGEPAAAQTLKAGADLVAFSGDKLLGGPQAGIIAGRADLVARCAGHPLARAVRTGDLVLQALQETALAYLRRDGEAIPFWRMASLPVEGLRTRARSLGVGEVVDTMAVPGGGTLPGVEIPSAGVRLDGDCTEPLRASDPPIVARVADDATYLDLRTVDPSDDAAVALAVKAAQ